MQTNWIIERCRYEFDVSLVDSNGVEKEKLTVSTVKPDDWCYAESIMINSDLTGLHAINPFTGQTLPLVFDTTTNKARIIKGLKKSKGTLNPTGKRVIEDYHLRDWLISRQRYWGTPIPIVHCQGCGIVPIPEEDLPVVLPEDVTFQGKGGSPLAQKEDWVRTICPRCKGPARRETDTMDTFMDSSWYFIRYTDAQNKNAIASQEAIKKWLPIDVYVGGVEHAILHLLYARFMNRFVMEELGVAISEPFAGLITQGLVEGLTHKCPTTNRYLKPSEIIQQGKEMVVRTTGEPTATNWEKMSKSKHNGVDPVDLVAIYGADTLRLCVLFKAPPEVPLRWNIREIAGPQRWIIRLLNLAERVASLSENQGDVQRKGGLEDSLHKTINAVRGVDALSYV
jgi:leucyl-tRNA synthetase